MIAPHFFFMTTSSALSLLGESHSWRLDDYDYYAEGSLRSVLGPDFRLGTASLDIGKVAREELVASIRSWQAKTRSQFSLLSQANPTPAVYDAKVACWGALASRISLEADHRYANCSWFALQRFRGGDWRLFQDCGREALTADPLRKARGAQWKSVLEERSFLPTVKGMPDEVVVTPFLPSINAYDALARSGDISDFGPFDWVRDISLEQAICCLPAMTFALAHMHQRGVSVGEATMANMIFSERGVPMFVGVDTRYQGISRVEQRATDIRTMILSVFSSLQGRFGDQVKVGQVIGPVLKKYPFYDVSTQLPALNRAPLSWRRRLGFDGFSQYRLGGNLAQFEQVRIALANWKK